MLSLFVDPMNHGKSGVLDLPIFLALYVPHDEPLSESGHWLSVSALYIELAKRDWAIRAVTFSDLRGVFLKSAVLCDVYLYT